jgi:hypothetical protein
MNTFERFHIYNEKRLDDQINDKCTVKYNPIYNAVIHKSSYRGHSVDLAQSRKNRAELSQY